MALGKTVAIVSRKQFITPHFIRIYFKSEDAKQFRNTTIGDNNKIIIPPEGTNEVHFPDLDGTKQGTEGATPTIRTYTHRGINYENNELIIDFVYHGDNGPASRWAMNAREGSKLGVLMRTQPKVLYPQVSWYLLAGDATAIPVISAILETLPKTASGICILEVYGKEDEQELRTNADIEFIWLHNPAPEKGSELASVVRSLTLPDGSRFGYVAAEFSSVKDIRQYLRKEKGWEKTELHAFSYWKAGVAEDRSKEDRRKEKMDD